MIRSGLVLGMLMFCTIATFSQISEGGTPPSFQKKSLTNKIDEVFLRPIDIEKARAENDVEADKGILREYARNIFTDLTMENSGAWSDLADGSRIWRLSITSEGALALGVYYNDFYIPQGGKLFLYNHDKSQVIGAFTNFNNTPTGLFATELIQGDKVTLEYYEPADVKENAIINISEIAYAYRDVPFFNNSTSREFGDSDNCQVNINCSEGDNWQKQKKGVARISVRSPAGAGWCSGSLVNNTNGDCYPYFLTAEHCAKEVEDEHLSQWMFYFDFEAPGCDNPSSQPSYTTTSGCKFVAKGPIEGGSDFFFVSLFNYVPEIEPYYNGWDRSTASKSGVGIHHPSGDIKKISTYTLTPSTYSPVISGSYMAKNSSWKLQWSETENGHGVTEGGSSGSPLFNSNGRIIGTLSGGRSFCSSPYAYDMYGKFSYHWFANGNLHSDQLQPWLDPDDSNLMYLDGKTCLESPTIVDFSTPTRIIAIDEIITFYNYSLFKNNATTKYKWIIEGAKFNPSLKSPRVKFPSEGYYDVTLEVTVDSVTTSFTKKNYIICGSPDPIIGIDQIDNPEISIYPNPASDIVHMKLKNLSSDNVEISVYDIYGKIIKGITQSTVASNQISLNFSTTSQGVYFINVKTDNGNYVRQISLIK